jgi:hypothetical protein
MTPDEYSDIKQLHKFAIAYDAFTEVSKACEDIIARELKSDDPLYHVMTIGIVTLYCRPFTKSARIGKLSADLVPTEFEWVHSSLLELRDKAFAHSDFDGQLPGHGKMTDARIMLDGTKAVFFSSRSTLEPALLPHIRALSTLLAQKVAQSRENFYRRVMRTVLPALQQDGAGNEWLLNLEDETGPMLVKSTDPIRQKYSVVRPLPEPPAQN